jgi:hypothetical protein
MSLRTGLLHGVKNWLAWSRMLNSLTTKKLTKIVKDVHHRALMHMKVFVAVVENWLAVVEL